MHRMIVLAAAVVLGLGLFVARAAPATKPTDAQIAHIAYTADQLDIEAGKQASAKIGDWLGKASQRSCQPLRGLGNAGPERQDIAFECGPRRLLPSGTGEELMADQSQEIFGRVGLSRVEAGEPILHDPASPPRRGQCVAGQQRCLQGGFEQRAGCHEVFDSVAREVGHRNVHEAVDGASRDGIVGDYLEGGAAHVL